MKHGDDPHAPLPPSAVSLKYRCRACEKEWDLAQTRDCRYVSSRVRVCGDAFCEATCDPVESVSPSADKIQQKMRPLVLHTINTEGDYERAKGWLRYEVLRTMDIRRFTELVDRNIAGENFDEMVDQIIVEREGL